MKKRIATLITLISFIPLPMICMDKPFQCKVPLNCISQMSEAPTREQELKKLADNWDWQGDVEQATRLDELRTKFLERNKLHQLEPHIEQEAHKALAHCNIHEPVIILQDNNSANSISYSILDNLRQPVKAISLGVSKNGQKKSLHTIRFSLYHECAHIMNGDIERSTLKDRAQGGLLLGTGLYAGVKTFSTLSDSNLVLRCFASIATTIATPLLADFICKKTIGSSISRKKEKNADIIAIRTLIDIGDYETLVYRFNDLTNEIDNGNANFKNEIGCFHSHPSYYQRAQLVLDEFKRAGFVDLKNLPIKAPLQATFSKQLTKHFPDYA